MKESAYTKKALPIWQEKHPNARIYRNNTGMAWQGELEPDWTIRGVAAKLLRHIRPIFFGVGKPVKDKKTGRMIQKGGGDYIGFETVSVCDIIMKYAEICLGDCKECNLKNKKIAIFTNVEIKQKNGRESKEQKDFREIVTGAGGISVVLKEGEEIL